MKMNGNAIGKVDTKQSKPAASATSQSRLDDHNHHARPLPRLVRRRSGGGGGTLRIRLARAVGDGLRPDELAPRFAVR
jgi:hypothetical protein